MFTLLVPEDFRPEDYGWEVTNPVVPHQQLQVAMHELHRYGFVSTQYARFQIPFALRFGLIIAGYRPDRRQYRVFYMRPFACMDEKLTGDALWAEIRWGYGRAGGFGEHPSVSQPAD